MNKNSFLPPLSQFLMLLLSKYILKWQYMAGNRAGARAKIREKKVEPEPDLKSNNFGSATLV